jgi:hypothetical protein
MRSGRSPRASARAVIELIGQLTPAQADELADALAAASLRTEANKRLARFACRLCDALMATEGTPVALRLRRAAIFTYASDAMAARLNEVVGELLPDAAAARKRRAGQRPKLETYRAVIERHNAGVSPTRAARELGLKPNTHRQRLRRAFKYFREAFTRTLPGKRL